MHYWTFKAPLPPHVDNEKAAESAPMQLGPNKPTLSIDDMNE